MRWDIHRSTSAVVQWVAAPVAHSASTTATVAVEEARVGLVEDDEDAVIGDVEVAGALGMVVETEDGGGGAPAQDPSAHLQSVGERGEAVGPSLLGVGEGTEPESGAGDDTEDALGSRRTPGSDRARWPPAAPCSRCG